jgi:hypothetical protein
VVGFIYVCSSLGALTGASLGTVQEKLKTRLDLLNGVLSGDFKVECKLYLRTDGTQIPVHTAKLSFLNKKPQFFTLLKNNIVQSSTGMEELFERLKHKNKLFTERKTVNIEGFQYELEDFLVSVGTVSVGTSAKCLCLEIEYLPCLRLKETTQLLKEFSSMLIPADLLWTFTCGSDEGFCYYID